MIDSSLVITFPVCGSNRLGNFKMEHLKRVLDFITDFDLLKAGKIVDRWRYKELPKGEEIVNHLKNTGMLEHYIDQESDSDSPFPYFIMEKGTGYDFFYSFRGLRVGEKYFDHLEDAVKEKFQYALDAVYGANR